MARRSRRSNTRRSNESTTYNARASSIDLAISNLEKDLGYRPSRYYKNRSVFHDIVRPFRDDLRTISEYRYRRRSRRVNRIIDQDYISEANAMFAHASFLDRRKALRRPMSAVDKCVKHCKGKSRRKRGRWRGGTSPGFATVIKDRICQLRCK